MYKQEALIEYIDILFASYVDSKEVQQLKNDMLVEAEGIFREGLVIGLDEERALLKAQSYLAERVSEDSSLIYVERFYKGSLESAIMYIISALVLVLPTVIIKSIIGIAICGLLFASLLLVVYYLFFIYNNPSDKLEFYCFEKYQIRRSFVWRVWGISYVVYVFIMCLISFTTESWFSSPIEIMGPIDVALLVARFYAPAVTVMLPVMFPDRDRILFGYEAENILGQVVKPSNTNAKNIDIKLEKTVTIDCVNGDFTQENCKQ